MLDADLNLNPGLAESREFSDDATQLTFTLRMASSSTMARTLLPRT